MTVVPAGWSAECWNPRPGKGRSRLSGRKALDGVAPRTTGAQAEQGPGSRPGGAPDGQGPLRRSATRRRGSLGGKLVLAVSVLAVDRPQMVARSFPRRRDSTSRSTSTSSVAGRRQPGRAAPKSCPLAPIGRAQGRGRVTPSSSRQLHAPTGPSSRCPMCPPPDRRPG
jgi:hypothetical protein